jgi:hypothetical protein
VVIFSYLINFKVLSTFDQISEDELNYILADDININILNDSTRLRLYKTTIKAGGIHLLNKIDRDRLIFPIRNGPNSPGSLLDHFITDATFKLCNIETVLSEHRRLILAIKKPSRPVYETVSKRSNHRNIINEIRNFMSECTDRTLQSLHSFLVETIRNKTTSSPQR